MGVNPRRTSALADRTGRRLVYALIGYFLFVTLVITLSPFDFAPRPFTLSLLVVPSDIVANVALFVPIGFLFRSLRGPGHRNWSTVLLAAAFSMGIESAQTFLPNRHVSPIDLATNTLGAYAGIVLRQRVERWAIWNPSVVGQIGLDIPLVGLLYLLVPQLWLSSVGLVQDAWRSVTTLLLGCAGSIALVSLHRHRWQGGARVAANIVPPLALLWFVVGVLPALAGSPQTFGVLSLVVVLVTLLLLRGGQAAEERRFESETLQRFVPIFAIYLTVAALWPPYRALVPWHGALTFDPRIAKSVVELLILLEQVGGFTLLGYALAEWRGRRNLSLWRGLPPIGGASLALALTLEIAQGYLLGPGASGIRALLATSGAVYGAAMYHLARSHVRALRAQDSEDARRAA